MEGCRLRTLKHSDDRSERLGIAENHSTRLEEAYKKTSAYHASHATLTRDYQEVGERC